jgi:molybdopterin biosynthesis enzyme
VQAYVTKQSKKRVLAADIRAVFNAPSANEAKRQLDLLIDKYQETFAF